MLSYGVKTPAIYIVLLSLILFPIASVETLGVLLPHVANLHVTMSELCELLCVTLFPGVCYP